jgi:hypothetical protein
VDLVKEYSGTTEMADDGWDSNYPAYRMVQAMESQDPAPEKYKIGKRTRLDTQVIKLTVVIAAEGYVYTGLKVRDQVVPDYTVLAAATTTTVATALAALIAALAGVSAAAVGAVITITGDAAGDVWDVQGFRACKMDLENTTVDTGIADDMDDMFGEDPDFYGVCPDLLGKDGAVELATWVEANKRLYIHSTADTACTDAGSTTDVAAEVMAAAYERTTVAYHQTRLLHWLGVYWMGAMLPTDPGAATWVFKTLAGLAVATGASKLKSGQISALTAKKASYYQEMAGINATFGGMTSSGRFLDLVHGLDWLRSEMQVDVWALLANADKIPFTNAGVAKVIATMKAVLQRGVNVGLLSSDVAPFVTAPDVKDVSTADKANRRLPNVTFGGVLAGAIHKVVAGGTLKV